MSTGTITPPRVASITTALNAPQAGTRLTDMRQAKPQEALVTDRHRHRCWKLLPYRCAEGEGWLICAPARARPQPVTVPLGVSGRRQAFVFF